MGVPQFCHDRIQSMTEQFLKGDGFGEIYECCVLTYLEVSLAARGIDPNKMWDQWLAVLQEETGKKEPLARHLADTPEGRQKLVEKLKQFRLKYSLPTARRFSLADSSIGTVEAEEPQPEEVETLDEFDLLFGDEE